MIKQTAEQKKREELLDKDWVEDIVFVHHNIHSCAEIDTMIELSDMSIDWRSCPICSAEVKEDGTIEHSVQ